MPLNIYINYIQTFTLFPGVAFLKVFRGEISPSYSITMLLFTFNLMDTLGKYASNYVKLNQ